MEELKQYIKDSIQNRKVVKFPFKAKDSFKIEMIKKNSKLTDDDIKSMIVLFKNSDNLNEEEVIEAIFNYTISSKFNNLLKPIIKQKETKKEEEQEQDKDNNKEEQEQKETNNEEENKESIGVEVAKNK